MRTNEVLSFLSLIWADWSSRVTGSLSALLVILGLALFVLSAFGIKIPNEVLIQFATWLLVAVCGVLASYSVWVRERREKETLQERLRAKLRLEYAPEETIRRHPNGVKQTYLAAFNNSEVVVSGVEVKVEEVTFKGAPDAPYGPTNFNSRVNLGWCCKEDENEQKFSEINLPPGRELLDFIAGPYPLPILVSAAPEGRPGFKIIIHPGHWPYYACFWQAGLYRVVIQISGLDSGAPSRLVCIVDWDGNDFSIASETSPLVAKSDKSVAQPFFL